MSQKKSKQISWVDLYLPEKARPYAYLSRLDKSIGSWLVAWPSFWAIALAAAPGSLPDVKMLIVLGLWAIVIRGAGCTINDYFDREFDKKVARTSTRPLASGALTPGQALKWLGFQLILSLVILLQLNNLRIVWGIIPVPLIFVYPLIKRISYWPQAFLGVMANWGVLLGSISIEGGFDGKIAYPLYVSSFFWTLICDTIYAHQDKEDDAKIGIFSTALSFAGSTRAWTSMFAVHCIVALVLGGVLNNIGWPYFLFVGIASCQLAWQIWTVDLSSPLDCAKKFVSNKWFGAIVFSGIVVGRICY